MKEVVFSNLTAWAPGLLDSQENWKAWSLEKLQIDAVKDSPKLEYTNPLFRRRLSQITKMTVHVVHNLLENSKIDINTKIVFVSLRGEIQREFSVNRDLIEENMILPASFSLSVFNTPVSQATLAFGMKGGYSVLYPSHGNFSDALKMAAAPVLAGTENQIIFIYADELIPEEYKGVIENKSVENIPMAFAGIISLKENTDKSKGAVVKLDSVSKSPAMFLKTLINDLY